MARQRGKGGRGGANQPRKRGGGGGGPRRGRGGPGGRAGRGSKAPELASYYMQPGKRGTVVVLHRPVGNRASPKVCGVMPSRIHAKALVDQLKRAESALHDLFYEATDDGIEALEAVLAASRDAVLTRMPPEGENALTVDDMVEERLRIQAELDSKATQERAAS